MIRPHGHLCAPAVYRGNTMKSTLLSELESASRGSPQTGRIDIMRKKRTKEDLKESMIFFFTKHYTYLFCFTFKPDLLSGTQYIRGGERWSQRATFLQSLAPTLKKIPDCILKSFISWFRCVWLGLELNSAGTPALQDQPCLINPCNRWCMNL